MPRYYVNVPMTAVVSFEIQAADEDEAKNKAFECSFGLNVEPFDQEAKECNPDILEIELHEIVAQGNVFHGVANEIEIEEIED